MTQPRDTSELWRKIVEIHNHTKVHLIYCEEAEVEHETFLQPRNELCNSLEHIVRAKAFELGMGNGQPARDDYVYDTLDKALGHEYRAFFDVCDWLSIILREQCRRDLEPYTPDVIQAVIPSYYTQIRPELDSLPQRIADIRARKDIKGDVLGEVHEYNAILTKLKDFVASLSAQIPRLEERKLPITLRSEITAELAAYEPDVVMKVIPDYYSKIRPQLEGLSPNLEELKAFRMSLPAKIPSLNEVKRGDERKKWWAVFLLMAAALIGAVARWLWEKTH